MKEKFNEAKQREKLCKMGDEAAGILFRLPEIVKIIRFGSTHRGKVKPTSDEDLCLLFDENKTTFDEIIDKAKKILQENGFVTPVYLGGIHLEAFSEKEFEEFRILDPRQFPQDKSKQFQIREVQKIARGKVLFE